MSVVVRKFGDYRIVFYLVFVFWIFDVEKEKRKS